MNCPDCGTKMRFLSESVTLVGFPIFTDDQGREHHHDDNCLKRRYACESDVCKGVVHTESLRRTCNVEGCDWKGKTECFCHTGQKVDHWTDDKPEE